MSGALVWGNYWLSTGFIRETDMIYNTMDGLFHKKRYFGEMLSGAQAKKDLRINGWQEKIDEEITGVCQALKEKVLLQNRLHEKRTMVSLATAALDPVAECEVYAGFDKMVGSKTAPYISHRLASCRFCGDILVFDQGRVVQRGEPMSSLRHRRGFTGSSGRPRRSTMSRNAGRQFCKLFLWGYSLVFWREVT